MNRLFKLSLLALAIFLLSSTVMAAKKSPHVVSVQADFSVIDTKGNDNSQELNDNTTAILRCHINIVSMTTLLLVSAIYMVIVIFLYNNCRYFY
jgi:hypothetical protein